MNEIVLQCENLSRHYRQGDHTLVVLDQLDFRVSRGESVAIIGASGSGKTTLLNLMGGIDTATSGRVLIAGKDISNLDPRSQDALRNRTLGFVYQFHHLLGEFTAQENVAMPLIIARQDFNASMAKARMLLEKTGMGERLTHKPSALSGGERQRVAIARALINDPACVLMDEPTGNLDPNTAAAIHQLMQDLTREFTTSFIVVTHDHHLASQMDRVMVLDKGKLVEQEQAAPDA